jgi:hypothetical protein
MNRYNKWVITSFPLCYSQEKENVENTAKLLLSLARTEKKYDEMIEYSERTASFRMKVSDLPAFLPNIERMLRKLRVIASSSFRGQKCRVLKD